MAAVLSVGVAVLLLLFAVIAAPDCTVKRGESVPEVEDYGSLSQCSDL